MIDPGKADTPRVCRFDGDTFCWEGVEPRVYKDRTASGNGLGWRGVTRHTLFGRHGEPAAFELRYFEIEPGGYSSLEQHRHVHAVTILRGRGQVIVGEHAYAAKPFDFFYIPPDTPHQFVNDGDAPFGFLCVVDADRDRPQPPPAETLQALRRNAATAVVVRDGRGLTGAAHSAHAKDPAYSEDTLAQE